MHDWDVTKNSYASPSTFCLKLAVLRRHNVLPSFHRIKVSGKNLSGINEIRMSTINISLRGVLSTFNSFQQLWWDGSNVFNISKIYILNIFIYILNVLNAFNILNIRNVFNVFYILNVFNIPDLCNENFDNFVVPAVLIPHLPRFAS